MECHKTIMRSPYASHSFDISGDIFCTLGTMTGLQVAVSGVEFRASSHVLHDHTEEGHSFRRVHVAV